MTEEGRLAGGSTESAEDGQSGGIGEKGGTGSSQGRRPWDWRSRAVWRASCHPDSGEMDCQPPGLARMARKAGLRARQIVWGPSSCTHWSP